MTMTSRPATNVLLVKRHRSLQTVYITSNNRNWYLVAVWILLSNDRNDNHRVDNFIRHIRFYVLTPDRPAPVQGPARDEG
jgi:hypothetical protein